MHLTLSVVCLVSLVVLMAVPDVVYVDYTNKAETVWYGSFRIGLWQWCSAPAFSSLPLSAADEDSDKEWHCQPYSSSDVELLFPSHSAMFNACRALLLLSSVFLALAIVHLIGQLRRLFKPQRLAPLCLPVLAFLCSFVALLLASPLTPPFQQAQESFFSLYCTRPQRGCWLSANMSQWSKAIIVVGLAGGMWLVLLHCCCSGVKRQLQDDVEEGNVSPPPLTVAINSTPQRRDQLE